MALSPTFLLIAYSVLAPAAALIGGVLPTLIHLTHTRLQVAVNFVGGLMLGLSLLGMLPLTNLTMTAHQRLTLPQGSGAYLLNARVNAQ